MLVGEQGHEDVPFAYCYQRQWWNSTHATLNFDNYCRCL